MVERFELAHFYPMGGENPEPTATPHEFPFVGTAAEARATIARLVAGVPHPQLGRVVHGGVVGGHSGPVGGDWSGRVARARGGRQPPEHCGRTPRRTRRRGDAGKKPPRIVWDGAQHGSDGDDCGSDDAGAALDLNLSAAPTDAAPPRLHRRARLHEPILVEDFVQEALVACIRRSCGAPSSLPMRRYEAPVTARVVGDPKARSRAIVLRSGAGKRDVSILWVSARDGILCSCFAGTQNAMFLSASNRSSKCSHTSAFGKALTASGVDRALFKSRMRLRADAADSAVAKEYDSTIVWAVLYHSVFSVVSFNAANAALCVAPCCRRFRGRCGHVRVVRSQHGPDVFNNPLHGSSLMAVKSRKEARKPPVRLRAQVLNNEEEDEGVEKQPSDTLRAANDAGVESVCKRTRRNLLPCAGEIGQGEVWNRTADWRTLLLRCGAGPSADKTSTVRQMGRLFSAAIGVRAVRDLRHHLVEPFCGSCGQQRKERHKVEKERAILTTHHPTADPIKVSL